VLGGCKLAISATEPRAVPKSVFPTPKFQKDKSEQVTGVSVNGICGYFKILQNPPRLGASKGLEFLTLSP